MHVIGAGYPTCRKSGIPVREPPKNICDVNPWVCRMSPIDISNLQSRPQPSVGRMTFEPHPRGCNCCQERFGPPKLSDEESLRRSLYKKKKRCSLGGNRRSRESKFKQYSVDLGVPNDLTAEFDPAIRKWTQKLEGKKMVRLLREKKRREDFVTACCQGLLMSPCGSVDSDCALNDNKEQANFFIKANCAPIIQECPTVKPCNTVTTIKKNRADFPCQCRNCKYVKHEGGPTTGCKQSIVEEKTVCYCTDEEKCETDPEPRLTGCTPCVEYQTPGLCQTRTVVDNCRADCIQPGGKVLFTAALTQEMLLQLARNGVDMANCIPTKNQYLIDCQSSPCAPDTVESTCRVYNNCGQLLRSPCANNPDCTTTTNCNDILECRKVGEMNCPPYQRCNVYNCQRPQNNRVACRILPDCTKVYDVGCEPYCRRGSFQDCYIPCGHICIKKGAVPDCAGDMSRSRRWSTAQGRLSSFQESLNIFSSSWKTSETSRLAGKRRPSRLSDERTSDLLRSSETPEPKRSSEQSSLTMNPWAYYGPGIETDGEVSKEERKKKNLKAKRKNEPRDSARKRFSKQTETTKHYYRERSRSRSLSPNKSAKSKVEQITRDSAKKVKSSHGPSSPPHFDDIEPSCKPIVTAKSGYEADLMEAMERVKRRYMEHNYDTTGSSSRATTTTEHCKTPTIKEFMGLTEQIKCLRKELRKYCKNDNA